MVSDFWTETILCQFSLVWQTIICSGSAGDLQSFELSVCVDIRFSERPCQILLCGVGERNSETKG